MPTSTNDYAKLPIVFSIVRAVAAIEPELAAQLDQAIPREDFRITRKQIEAVAERNLAEAIHMVYALPNEDADFYFYWVRDIVNHQIHVDAEAAFHQIQGFDPSWIKQFIGAWASSFAHRLYDDEIGDKQFGSEVARWLLQFDFTRGLSEAFRLLARTDPDGAVEYARKLEKPAEQVEALLHIVEEMMGLEIILTYCCEECTPDADPGCEHLPLSYPDEIRRARD